MGYITNLDKAFGLSPDQLAILLEHLNSAVGMSDIPPRTGAVACLRKWSQVLDICVVTGRSPKHWPATRDWLEREKVTYDRLLFADKYGRFDAEDRASGANIVSTEELAAMDFAFAVEDSVEFSRTLARHGVPVLLMDRPWNREEETVPSASAAAGVIRCNGWKGVEREAPTLVPMLSGAE